MNKKVKADLEKLDTLREVALCGPEEKRDEAQEEYQQLRSELLEHEPCEGCDEDKITQKLVKDKS